MATIKYIQQSKSSTAPIYLRLSLEKKRSFKRKTGHIFDNKKWSTKSGFPKEGNAEGKAIKSKLKSLEAFIIHQFNLDNSKGDLIDGQWLNLSIEKYYGREEPSELSYLTDYGDDFVKRLPYRVTAKGKIGVSKDTITKYTTIVKKLKAFQKETEIRYFVKSVDLKFREQFISHLAEIEQINDNTIGRYISFVKTIILDARKNGIEISPQINDFKGFTIKPPIVTLTFEEIKKVKETSYKSDKLDIARDWLIIGCYTGQRVSDLLRMKTSMIIQVNNYNFIELKQVKTEKTIQIPIHLEVKNILKKRKGEFPPRFAKTTDSNNTMFNRYLKKVCQLANINEITEGNLNDPSINRYVKGNHPKWKLISSHTCRRSFCTNFYAQREYPTPLLMSVSGHSTESMFLEYIGKKPMDYALQLAEIWSEQENNIKENKKVKLTLLKTNTAS
jgi:integrase